MKRKLKKGIACALVVCILCTTLSVTGFAAKAPDSAPAEENAELDSLCILGDSIAAGYGLEKYSARLGSGKDWKLVLDTPAVEGCFGQLVSEKYGLKAKGHAHSAWRTTEFLRAINGDFDPDWTWTLADIQKAFSAYSPDNLRDILFTSMYAADPDFIKGETQNVPDDIRHSSIVTINFGANDIYTYSLANTIEKYADKLDSLGATDETATPLE